MAKMTKLQKAISASKKRRKKHPRLQPKDLSPISHSLKRKITGEYTDLLQNIEFAIVSCWDLDSGVNDLVVHQAVRAVILDELPAENSSQRVVLALRKIRDFREDIPEEIWTDALRVIIDSVKFHSTLREDSSEYLEFVSNFVV